jgi:NADH:ubiquinone oxidoreductase subunit E
MEIRQMALSVKPEHPDITEQMWIEIDKIIADHADIPGAVITVLRMSQDVVGYLPLELLDYIGHGLNFPRSSVYAVASFYSLFSFVPKGRHVIKICMGTACYVKGIKEVMDRISYNYNLGEGETSEDRRFSLESVRCVGACGLAPVMVVGHDTHGDVKSDKIIEILEEYK